MAPQTLNRETAPRAAAPADQCVTTDRSDLLAPRTEAGQRAAQRRRARLSANRRPPSGLLPSGRRVGGPVTAERLGRPVSVQPRVGRWARLVTTVSVAATAVVLSVALISGGPGVGGTVSAVTVEPGDTLWSIAQQFDPQADPRAVIDQIRTLNALGDDTIVPGVVLQVPTGG